MSPSGAAGGNLADLVVQFVMKGQQELQAGIAAIGESVKAMASAITAQTNALQAGMTKTVEKTQEAAKNATNLGEKFKAATNVINASLAAGVGVIAGFVRSGLAAGAMGQVLGFQMERLSLTMSGLFRPTIQAITDGLGRLTDWINNLSEAQKASIARWIEAGAAALAVGVILPKITAGIGAVIGAVAALGAAITGAEISTGFGAILPILGLMAEGITLFVVGTEQGRNMLAQVGDALKPILDMTKELAAKYSDDINNAINAITDDVIMVARATADVVKWTVKWADELGIIKGILQAFPALLESLVPGLSLLRQLGYGDNIDHTPKQKNHSPDVHRTGGFEDLNSTYRRIAVASIRATSGVKSPEERAVEQLEQANRNLKQINDTIYNKPSPYTR